MQERIFSAPEVKLNYFEGPKSGPPLLLLHGGSARWQAFNDLISDLAPKWHVYALDLRGHGKSGRVPGKYRLQDYESDIAAFIRDCIQEPTIIFGHSLGGFIAVMVAANHQELTHALIIGDAPPSLDALGQTHHRATVKLWRELASSGDAALIRTELKNMPMPAAENSSELVPAREIFGEDNPWFDFMAASLSQNDPDMLTAVLEFETTFAAYKTEELYPKINCPVLLLRGNPEQGGTISDSDAKWALDLLPNAQQALVPTTGHELFMSDKAATLAAMLPFLKTV